jgi:hypothetical protein
VPLDPAFIDDCPYGPGALFLDEMLEIDRERGLIRARIPTREDLPLTNDQRAHPVRHPRHVSGGLMIHVTGMLGFAHAYYVLDLRHADGWIGYGTHIHDGKFRKLAHIGEPLVGECRHIDVRRVRGNIFARYRFRFLQQDDVVYDGEQSAVWRKT